MFFIGMLWERSTNDRIFYDKFRKTYEFGKVFFILFYCVVDFYLSHYMNQLLTIFKLVKLKIFLLESTQEKQFRTIRSTEILLTTPDAKQIGSNASVYYGCVFESLKWQFAVCVCVCSFEYM